MRKGVALSRAREKLLEGNALAGGVWVYGDEPSIGLDEKIAARRRRKELEPLPRPCTCIVSGERKLDFNLRWRWREC